MVHFSAIDSVVVIAYFALVVFIGFRAARKRTSDSEDFLLAGRTLTLPMFVATLVSTWYGGILGVGEFSYTYGISNWIVFGVPYYIFALVFALFLAKRVRGTGLITIPDKLEQAYGRKTALLGSVLTLVLVTPAAYVLMLGILVQLVFGLDLTTSILLTTFLSLCYLYSGGFRSGVWVNAFEFVMMFLGFALMLLFAWSKFGGVEFIRAAVPPLHLTWHGGNSWQFIAVWFFIALWTLVDPAFHQRCYAARDGKTARRGILVSILFWLVFDFLTSMTGLYARAALPELKEPMFSYPMLAELTLPGLAKGLFYVGMLATIMSTLSSLSLISAITVGKDIAGRFVEGVERLAVVKKWTNIGLVLSGVLSVLFALMVPSVVRIWYTIGTCVVPGLLVPLMASYFDRLRIPAGYAFAAMLSGWGVSTLSLFSGHLNGAGQAPEYFLGVEPMIPGLAVSVLVWGAGRFAGNQAEQRMKSKPSEGSEIT